LITEAEFDGNQKAQVKARISDGGHVLSPGGGTMVTSVNVKQGDLVSDGTLIYSVDGVGVWAVKGATPLYRPLSRGDKGTDVEVLQRFLKAYLKIDDVAVTGEVDAKTDRLIRQWQRKAGLEENGTADPARFVRISSEFTVSKVLVTVGMPAPPLGTAVLAEPQTLQSLVVTGATLTNEATQDYIFITSGQSLRLVFDGKDWSAVDGKEALAFVSIFDSISDTEVSSSKSESEGRTAADNEIVIDGRLTLALPVTVAGLPPGALVSSPTGKACVWLEKSSSSSATEVTYQVVSDVEVVGVSLTGTALVADLDLIGQRILLNPTDLVNVSACR
jgi:peptidoglycan hydrolase-like protein with peptidoglycan-binding domain